MTRTEHYWNLKDITNDLKYLMRLTATDFQNLFFPTFNPDFAVDMDHIRTKWALFATNPLGFIWSCSEDKLEIISEYIQDVKREEA